jgi:hypothetical protein
VFGLRPCDMEDLTVQQIADIGDYLEELKRAK